MQDFVKIYVLQRIEYPALILILLKIVGNLKKIVLLPVNFVENMIKLGVGLEDKSIRARRANVAKMFTYMSENPDDVENASELNWSRISKDMKEEQLYLNSTTFIFPGSISNISG